MQQVVTEPLPVEKEFPDFMKKVKEESRMYHNFSCILEKAERDGYIGSIQKTLTGIFEQEMTFAVVGLFSRTFKNSSQK